MKLRILATLALTGAIAAGPASAVDVKIELALLVDVSGSVSTTEFNLQRQGYVNAFNDPAIQASIASGNSLAATFIYWSSGSQQQIAVPWTLINSAASASSFAAAVLAAARPFSGNTGPGSAINFATPLFGSNDFTSARQVIDVSGDGVQNSGADTSDARDAALAAGIDQINGLPIGSASVLAFYQNNIQGGIGSFTQPANTFEDFDAAVRSKIGREIVTTIPEPETYALMLAGLGAVGWMARRRKAGAAAKV